MLGLQCCAAGSSPGGGWCCPWAPMKVLKVLESESEFQSLDVKVKVDSSLGSYHQPPHAGTAVLCCWLLSGWRLVLPLGSDAAQLAQLCEHAVSSQPACRPKTIPKPDVKTTPDLQKSPLTPRRRLKRNLCLLSNSPGAQISENTDLPCPKQLRL